MLLYALDEAYLYIFFQTVSIFLFSSPLVLVDTSEVHIRSIYYMTKGAAGWTVNPCGKHDGDFQVFGNLQQHLHSPPYGKLHKVNISHSPPAAKQMSPQCWSSEMDSSL